MKDKFSGQGKRVKMVEVSASASLCVKVVLFLHSDYKKIFEILFLINANIFEFLRTMWQARAVCARMGRGRVFCARRVLLWKYLRNIEFKWS